MTSAEKFQAQLDRCCGPVRKPYVKPKLTGIQKELRLQQEKQQGE
jgi:hypothetical protein